MYICICNAKYIIDESLSQLSLQLMTKFPLIDHNLKPIKITKLSPPSLPLDSLCNLTLIPLFHNLLFNNSLM